MRYCFICPKCGRLFSLDTTENSAELVCDVCGTKMRRNYKGEQVNFILTGDGFYSTEHRDTQKDKGS